MMASVHWGWRKPRWCKLVSGRRHSVLLFLAAVVLASIFAWIYQTVLVFKARAPVSRQEAFIIQHLKIDPEPKSWLSVEESHLQRLLNLTGPKKEEINNSVLPCPFPVLPRSSESRVNVSLVQFFSREEVQVWAEKNMALDMSPFYPVLDKVTKMALLSTYLVLAHALQQADIPHFVTDDSLLGIYRISGILPWADNIHIVVNSSQWLHLRNVLTCIEGYQLSFDSPIRWIFFPKNNPSLEIHKYPCIDIFFFQEDTTHVIILHWITAFRVIFSKYIIFPLSSALMEGIQVLVPYDIHSTLMTVYNDLTLCTSQLVLHNQINPSYKEVTLPCSVLFPIYGKFNL